MVRVGQTVRRPVRPFTATIQAYLAHVRSRGFTECPEPLGYDAQGREILSYVAGDVPVEPLPAYATTVEALGALGALIRRLHEAADGWLPPTGATWGGTPGRRPAGVVPLIDKAELVSHMDYCPGNVVFADSRPKALIDFDLARPTTRVADLANALYWWAPLVDPEDRAPSLVKAHIPTRVRAFADAYGMTAGQRAQVIPSTPYAAMGDLCLPRPCRVLRAGPLFKESVTTSGAPPRGRLGRERSMVQASLLSEVVTHLLVQPLRGATSAPLPMTTSITTPAVTAAAAAAVAPVPSQPTTRPISPMPASSHPRVRKTGARKAAANGTKCKPTPRATRAGMRASRSAWARATPRGRRTGACRPPTLGRPDQPGGAAAARPVAPRRGGATPPRRRTPRRRRR
ncbi:aminoglycoside phosphotransferase family protein [Ornithinimicrobium pratense]|uniref:Aminoglycoside phosphotransferase family protein n=1 Tax=Ornithinimicrobium pratense TaxID=2593973 RepID=A0A5J6VAU0_9MICO|nr:aminoglycoside phosphotransferase family protein [Ornithinimicrobium pratense]